MAWKLLERGGSRLVQLVVQIVLARILAPEQFGALAIILVFINLANILVESGFNTALVQSPRLDKDDCSTVFWLSFGIACVMVILIVITAPYISAFYQIDYLTGPLRAMALILLINAFNAVQLAIVQRQLEFKIVFIASMLSVCVSGVLGITAALNGAGLWALVIQQLMYQVVNCVVLFWQVRWYPHLVLKIERAKVLFSFGWKILAAGLLDQGYQSLSNLVIGKQFSTSSLGYVSQGQKYPQALGQMIDSSIRTVMLSAVSRIQEDSAYVKRLARRAVRTSSYLCVPCMALFALVSEPLVEILLGKQWISAVPFLQMFCFVYALAAIHAANLEVFVGIGKSNLFLKLEIIKTLYGVAFVLISAFVFQDVYFLVASYMLAGIISTFVNAIPNKKFINYAYAEQLRDIGVAFVLSGVSMVVAYPIGLLALPDIAIIILQAFVMIGMYLLLSKLFKVEELSYLLATAKELFASKKN